MCVYSKQSVILIRLYRHGSYLSDNDIHIALLSRFDLVILAD